MSMLEPKASVAVGMATAGGTLAIYQLFSPGMGDVRTLDKGQKDVESVGKQAFWMSLAAVSGAYFLTGRDSTVLTIGGITLLYLEWSHRVNSWLASGASRAYDELAEVGEAQMIDEVEMYANVGGSPMGAY